MIHPRHARIAYGVAHNPRRPPPPPNTEAGSDSAALLTKKREIFSRSRGPYFTIGEFAFALQFRQLYRSPSYTPPATMPAVLADLEPHRSESDDAYMPDTNRIGRPAGQLPIAG